MLTGTTITLLAFIAHVHAEDLMNHMGDAQDSVDNLVNELVVQLFSRMQGYSAVQNAELDRTALGKPGQLPLGQQLPVGQIAVPASRLAPLYALPRVSTNVANLGAPPAPKPKTAPNRRITPPGKQDDRKFEGIPEELQGLTQSLTHRDTLKAMEHASSALADSQEAAAGAPLPYSINFHVHGGNLGTDGTLGEANMKYMEHRIENALKNAQQEIQAVDVRLNIEGQTKQVAAASSMPKTFRLEVTVKTKFRTIVLSNPKHAERTFIEAVDHMHDTLKRNMLKEKQKYIAKKRQEREGKDTEKPWTQDSEISEEDWMAADAMANAGLPK